jgi:mannose-6-phosphate isomerase-like protein (cupin superfamily)
MPCWRCLVSDKDLRLKVQILTHISKGVITFASPTRTLGRGARGDNTKNPKNCQNKQTNKQNTGRELKGTLGLQGLAPGAGTPIHEHDCEEVFVVERGAATCEYLIPGSTVMQRSTAYTNQTLYIPPNWRHRIVNEDPTIDLNYLVVLSNPPMRIRVYGGWEEEQPLRPEGLHIFDQSCPSHGPTVR